MLHGCAGSLEVLEPEITVRWLEVAAALAPVVLVIQEAMEATEVLVVIRVSVTPCACETSHTTKRFL